MRAPKHVYDNNWEDICNNGSTLPLEDPDYHESDWYLDEDESEACEE